MREFFRVAFAGHDRIDNGQTRYTRDVVNDMVDLQIHLRQRLVHVLDVLTGHAH